MARATAGNAIKIAYLPIQSLREGAGAIELRYCARGAGMPSAQRRFISGPAATGRSAVLRVETGHMFEQKTG